MDIQGVAGGVEILRKPLTPSRTRRKLSIPASLPLSVTGLGEVQAQAAFRRRFSNVGDAVSRKLSTTIGWRAGLITINASPPEEVVAVGRALCTLYIRTRLKKAGLFNKKLGLTRVRSAIGTLTGCGNIVKEVFPGLSHACQELERMYPKLYNNIWIHTGPPPAEGTVGILLAAGHHMMRTEPTWGKVLAIYCIAAGLSVDCVRQGQSEQLHVILEDMSELLEDKIAAWVHANGGWTGLNAHCRPKNQEVSVTEYVTIFGVVTIILLVAYFIVRFCVRFGV
ncbi:bcl-2-related ovarian killer protein-like [Anthonomus grandis grandis]|uniref:bcl-2-related ovarian killer protein-like n=1 Tax=Anthonomus grandis grandis TaxID=2921223 RepID=UPI002165E77B|nr:bcl-2-related ovarian killer protein-like [Anthonomus grandis grandis]XP_050309743.1 bcl-2-related ovarian killer protein-like [Anthonomus grandis grandis]XP_050309744.1 bcl-2-related ovarian killer protein-like [Anthonomus grandis grandis]XP_050309745.1 bcl-2-related ovarian killer protein-like [Anthonomus grandis grandis]